MPNVGGNFNLPGSHTQHWHIDRPFAQDFMIANVAVVDSNLENGATEVIPVLTSGSTSTRDSFWSGLVARAYACR